MYCTNGHNLNMLFFFTPVADTKMFDDQDFGGAIDEEEDEHLFVEGSRSNTRSDALVSVDEEEETSDLFGYVEHDESINALKLRLIHKHFYLSSFSFFL